MRRIICSVLLALVAAVSPALAPILQPGLWQDTETGEANGKPLPPKSPPLRFAEDAKDIAKRPQDELQKRCKQKQQCSKLDVKEYGNVIIFEMKCGDPKQGAIDMTMTFTVHSPQHTTNVPKRR